MKLINKIITISVLLPICCAQMSVIGCVSLGYASCGNAPGSGTLPPPAQCDWASSDGMSDACISGTEGSVTGQTCGYPYTDPEGCSQSVSYSGPTCPNGGGLQQVCTPASVSYPQGDPCQ